MILGPNGQPINSDKKIETEKSRAATILNDTIAELNKKGVQPNELADLAINLFMSYLSTVPADQMEKAVKSIMTIIAQKGGSLYEARVKEMKLVKSMQDKARKGPYGPQKK